MLKTERKKMKKATVSKINNSNVSEVTIICSTIERPDMVKRFINSVRKFYPEISIIIGDQSKDKKTLEEFYLENNVKCIRLPFDCGVGYARNECAKAVKTQFMLLCDDDFIFTSKTDVTIPITAMKCYPELGIVTGTVFDQHKVGDKVYFQKRYYEKLMHLDRARKILFSVPISYIKPQVYETPGYVFYQCDIGLNFALIRSDVFKSGVGWDSRYKCNGEHEDFYLNLKYNSNWKVAYTPEFFCDHNHISNSTYVALRDRQTGWLEFGKKWGVEQHLEIGHGLRDISAYLSETGHRERISSPDNLPCYHDGYVRIFPNGDCAACEGDNNALSSSTAFSDSMPRIPYDVLRKSFHKFQRARSTIIWKIFRPFMRLEGTIRKYLRKMYSHE